jgi:hypothetical protein
MMLFCSLQEEEWQMNMLYMNNISKYPQQRRDSCLARQSTHGSLQNRQQSTK